MLLERRMMRLARLYAARDRWNRRLPGYVLGRYGALSDAISRTKLPATDNRGARALELLNQARYIDTTGDANDGVRS